MTGPASPAGDRRPRTLGAMQIEPVPSHPVFAAAAASRPGTSDPAPDEVDGEVDAEEADGEVSVVATAEVAEVVEAPVEQAGEGAGEEVEVGPDRDLVALEALEAELAVLEAELARVDAGRGDDPGPNPGERP